MKKINLREVYPFYEHDCFVLVDDEIAEIFEESKRKEQNYQRNIYRNGAHYSLDRDDGIEHNAIFVSMSPYEIYERKMTNEELYSAISKLPDIQAKRIYAYYFLDMNEYSASSVHAFRSLSAILPAFECRLSGRQCDSL